MLSKQIWFILFLKDETETDCDDSRVVGDNLLCKIITIVDRHYIRDIYKYQAFHIKYRMSWILNVFIYCKYITIEIILNKYNKMDGEKIVYITCRIIL